MTCVILGARHKARDKQWVAYIIGRNPKGLGRTLLTWGLCACKIPLPEQGNGWGSCIYFVK